MVDSFLEFLSLTSVSLLVEFLLLIIILVGYVFDSFRRILITLGTPLYNSKVLVNNLLLNVEGDDGGASSALLYYQENKTTKFAWQFIYSDSNG